MKLPEFPVEFLKHCWRKDQCSSIEDYECAFRNAGAGMECETCNLFMTRPYLRHDLDRKFLPLIEKYYSDLAEYEKKMEEIEKSKMECGSGI